jgi:hypothetical protein
MLRLIVFIFCFATVPLLRAQDIHWTQFNQNPIYTSILHTPETSQKTSDSQQITALNGAASVFHFKQLHLLQIPNGKAMDWVLIYFTIKWVMANFRP